MMWLTTLLGAVSEPIKTYQKNKARKEELEAIAHGKRVERAQATEAKEFDADIERTKGLQNSWKDEFVLLVLSIPVIMCFIPGYDVYVTAGFTALETTPTWFQYLVVAVYSVSAGVPMANKTVNTIQSIVGAVKLDKPIK